MQYRIKIKTPLLLIICLLGIGSLLYGQSSTKQPVNKKILFVVTSHDQKGNTGQKTGYFLSEAAHPWAVLHDAGYDIDFVSPKGGNPPVDAFDLKDSINNRFWHNPAAHQKLTHSLTPDQVRPEDYSAIFYAGGHGAMWDFPDNGTLAKIAAKIYENGGIVAAVCHGPAALINVKLSNGQYLVNGKKVNGFTNAEEKARHLEAVVPFLLENKLKQRGGLFEQSGPFKPHVAIDTRLITGQNPASATGVGKALLKALQQQQP